MKSDTQRMSLGVISLCQPQSNTDGTLLKSFFPGTDALVLAHGSFIQFYKFPLIQKELIAEYQVFGEIVHVLPLKHPSDQKTNLLVLTSDFRFSILRYVNEIITVQSGSIRCSSGVELDPPFKVIVHPFAILIQITTNVLQFYRVTPNSQLRAPYNCTITCKSIISANFMQIDESLVRIVVLYESYKKTLLQVFEGDDTQQVFLPKQNFVSVMEQDAYLVRVLNDTTVLVFSTSAARRIHFLITAIPHITSSTIYTEYPIQYMIKLRECLYFAVDSQSQIQLVEVLDSGAVSVKRAGEVNTPCSLCRVDESRVLCIGKRGETLLIKVSHDPFPQKVTIENIFSGSGSIRKIIPVDKSEVAVLLSGNYAGALTREIELEDFAKMPVEQCNGIWFIERDLIAVSVEDQTFALRIADAEARIEEVPGISNGSRTLFLSNKEDILVQVTPRFMLVNGDLTEFKETAVSASVYGNICVVAFPSNVVAYQNKNIVLELNICNISQVSLNNDYVAICSWSERKAGVFDYRGNEVRTLENISVISVNFLEGNILAVVLENDDLLLLNVDTGETRKVHCNGKHSSASLQEGGLLIAGETPVLVSPNTVQVFGDKPFLYCSIYENRAAIVDSDGITLSEIIHSTPEVRTTQFNERIVDAISTPSADHFVICINTVDEMSGERKQQLCVSEHPLKVSKEDLTELPKERYIGMTALVSKDNRHLVAVAMENQLILYELIHGSLEKRSQKKLETPPFDVCAFGGLFLVASQTAIQLYKPAPVSRSNIDLIPISQYQTLGASCCVSCDGDEICIGDELESVSHIHYDRKQKTFEELERNTLPLSITHVIIRKDKGIFCVDDNGFLYKLKARTLRNYLALELEIVETYNIGCRATSIAESGNRIIIGTETGQLLGIIQPPTQCIQCLRLLSMNVVSFGRFSSDSYRQVLYKDSKWPCMSMWNLDLATLFLKLPEREKQSLSEKIRTDVKDLTLMCKSILESTYV